MIADALRLPRAARWSIGSVDRGVKKRPNLLGVMDGFRFSLRRLVLVGERKGFAGEELMAGGLDGRISGTGEP